MLSQNTMVLLKAAELGYKFDENNNVVSPSGCILNLIYCGGYPRFNIKFNKKSHYVMVHKLKAYYLYGDKIFMPGIQVRHLNENKNDWSDSNILLGTQSENKMDKSEKERIWLATNAAKSVRRFTDGEVAEIKKLNQHGISYKRLAKAYKTCKSTLSYIMNKKTYALVA